MLDRHDCYELCVQSPRHITAFLRGVHGNHPLILREDFCGTAAVSRRWVLEGLRQGDAGTRAFGIDLSLEALEKGAALGAAEGVGPELVLMQADCNMEVSDQRQPGESADVVFVGNFSIGYLHARTELIAYLGRTAARLRRGHAGFGGGVLVCDLYGGAGAFALGGLSRTHPGRGNEQIQYLWQHEQADPISGMVENVIGFRVLVDGEVVQDLPRAFVYHWRLWALSELREAMYEAGFRRVEVFKDVNVAPGEAPRPVVQPGELGPDWIVLVAAWV